MGDDWQNIFHLKMNEVQPFFTKTASAHDHSTIRMALHDGIGWYGYDLLPVSERQGTALPMIVIITRGREIGDPSKNAT